MVSLNNDQIKLWVEDILIIDTNDDTKKGTCNFIGDMLHAIKLEFVEVCFRFTVFDLFSFLTNN